MNDYRDVRKLRSPVTLTDRMILITPQKVGDDSDPSLPLNFAHDQGSQTQSNETQWQEPPPPVHVNGSESTPRSEDMLSFPLHSSGLPQDHTSYGGISNRPWLSPNPSPFKRLQPQYHSKTIILVSPTHLILLMYYRTQVRVSICLIWIHKLTLRVPISGPR